MQILLASVHIALERKLDLKVTSQQMIIIYYVCIYERTEYVNFYYIIIIIYTLFFCNRYIHMPFGGTSLLTIFSKVNRGFLLPLLQLMQLMLRSFLHVCRCNNKTTFLASHWIPHITTASGNLETFPSH